MVPVARHLHQLGFDLLCTRGTARNLRAAGIPVTEVLKVNEGRPNIVDRITNGEVQLVINTPTAGQAQREDQIVIRSEAVLYHVQVITTMAGAMVAVLGLEAVRGEGLSVKSLQEYHHEMGEEKQETFKFI